MKKILLIVLFLSVGFSQKLTEVVETYDNRNVKSITYHNKTRNRIEIVKYVSYYENGQKKSEITIKEGKRDKSYIEWYENGQKEYDITYKDGKEDGKATAWHENGQKKTEGTWKDGNLISSICWDKDGNECDECVGCGEIIGIPKTVESKKDVASELLQEINGSVKKSKEYKPN